MFGGAGILMTFVVSDVLRIFLICMLGLLGGNVSQVFIVSLVMTPFRWIDYSIMLIPPFLLSYLLEKSQFVAFTVAVASSVVAAGIVAFFAKSFRLGGDEVNV